MKTSTLQIVELAKKGFSAEEISEDLGANLGAVELIVEITPKASEKLEEKFARLENAALDVLDSAIQYGDVDSISFKAATYVLDQIQGLKTPNNGKTQINISDINLRLEQAQKALLPINV